MSIDVDDLVEKISAGIYGDDRMTWSTIESATTALSQLVAEVERLRAAAQDERAAVVAFLRKAPASDKETAKQYHHAEGLAYWRGVIEVLEDAADEIERGEHRREEER